MTKMKLTLSPVLFAMALAVLLVCAKSDVYASGVQVYLDGQLLTYNEAQPQIINDTTMVPLTETAEKLGMTYEWDAENSEMVFRKGNRRMEHEVYTNVIYINGVGKEYNMTSTVIEDRTVMPVRMLADAIGAEVEWDGPNARVLLTLPAEVPQTNNNNNNDSNTNNVNNNTNTSNVAPIASVYSIRVPDNNVTAGEKATVIVETNYAATKVRISDDEGNKLVESTDYNDTSAARVFEVEIYPEYLGEYTIKAAAGTDSGYAMGTKSTTIYVYQAVVAEINKVTPTSPKVDRNESIDLSVRTSTDVVKLVVEDEDGKTVKTRTSPSSKSSSYYTWETSFSISKNGTYDYKIVAYDENGKSVAYDYRIVVGSGKSSSDDKKSGGSKSDYAKINDVITLDDRGREEDEFETGEYVYLEIYTNRDVEKIEIELDDDVIKTIRSSDSYSSNQRLWETNFKVPSKRGSYTYYVYAYDDDGDYARDSFKIKVED